MDDLILKKGIFSVIRHKEQYYVREHYRVLRSFSVLQDAQKYLDEKYDEYKKNFGERYVAK